MNIYKLKTWSDKKLLIIFLFRCLVSSPPSSSSSQSFDLATFHQTHNRPKRKYAKLFWKHRTNNQEARGRSEREPLVAIIPPMKMSAWKTKPAVMRRMKWVKRTKWDSGTTIRWRFGRRDAGQTQGRRPGQWQTVFLFASFQGFCRDNTWKIPGQYLEKAWKLPGRNP